VAGQVGAADAHTWDDARARCDGNSEWYDGCEPECLDYDIRCAAWPTPNPLGSRLPNGKNVAWGVSFADGTLVDAFLGRAPALWYVRCVRLDPVGR
jgi:hypothetical protein